MTAKTIVKASKINEFIYCRQCFWKGLHALREVNDEMYKGTLYHDALAIRLIKFARLKVILFVSTFCLLLFVAILFLLQLFFKF